MPKYQCEKCGALYAGWSGGGICPICGGKLKLINRAKYYAEKEKQDKASKCEGK